MITTTHNFIFRDVYEYVALIERCAQYEDTFIELGLKDNSELAFRLQKPHKLSLLHEYIFAMIRTEQSREYRKNSDSYDEEHIERLKQVFEEYEVQLVSFPLVNFSSSACEAYGEFYEWFLINESAFLDYWEKVADEVFHIIFSNRRFLLQFGVSLSNYLSRTYEHLPQSALSTTGRIKRFNRIPLWLKKAVFYRDHGRCVFCKNDLSGLLATDRRLHLDHIVPLARWGSNDPSNFQLLCESCNLKKSGSPAQTSRFYVPWWDY